MFYRQWCILFFPLFFSDAQLAKSHTSQMDYCSNWEGTSRGGDIKCHLDEWRHFCRPEMLEKMSTWEIATAVNGSVKEQGWTLRVVRLPWTTESNCRTTELPTPLVRHGYCEGLSDQGIFRNSTFLLYRNTRKQHFNKSLMNKPKSKPFLWRHLLVHVLVPTGQVKFEPPCMPKHL